MPTVTKFRQARTVRQDPLFLFDARRPSTPASADMIAEVITHADVAVRMANGRMKLRVSPAMVESLQAQGRLGTDALRLTDLTVVWDEREGEVVTVRDDARLRDAADRWASWDALWDDDAYETEAEPPARRSHAA